MDITFEESDLLNTTDGNVSDEEITPGQVLRDIEIAWHNERFAPEILQHKADLVECMLGQIHHMEENIKKLKKGELVAVLHQMELNRIRYIITSYMRTRLKKIELFAKNILDREEQRAESPYLSPEEYKYAQQFLKIQETLFRNNGMNLMIGGARNMDWNEMTVRPNLNSYVFVKVNENIRGLLVEDDVIDLDVGSIQLMKYAPTMELVKNGSVQLT